ncbi:MAG: hypothetical protein ACEPOZ_00960 [Marinifilaceae bacterium]
MEAYNHIPMPNQTYYETELEAMQAIPKENIVRPRIPVPIYVQEATDLHRWGLKDREQLLALGLEAEIFDSLPSRIGALIHAQTVWKEQEKTSNQELQRLQQMLAEAKEVEKELHHYFQFAFRKLSNRYRHISFSSGNSSYEHLIQHLNDLSVIGTSNLDTLKALQMDPTLLQRAADYSDLLSEQRPKAMGSKTSNKQYLGLRNRAYTHLKQAVHLIRTNGKFIFRENPDRLKGYYSPYEKNRAVRYRKKLKEKGEAKSHA